MKFPVTVTLLNSGDTIVVKGSRTKSIRVYGLFGRLVSVIASSPNAFYWTHGTASSVGSARELLFPMNLAQPTNTNNPMESNYPDIEWTLPAGEDLIVAGPTNNTNFTVTAIVEYVPPLTKQTIKESMGDMYGIQK